MSFVRPECARRPHTSLWAYIFLQPFPRWLLTRGLKGAALHAVVFLSDALIDVIFCLPAAYPLCRLKPPRLPVYLILAIVPGRLGSALRALGNCAPAAP
jgi:hypothetical protein